MGMGWRHLITSSENRGDTTTKQPATKENAEEAQKKRLGWLPVKDSFAMNPPETGRHQTSRIFTTSY